jgi:hypothetical protein
MQSRRTIALWTIRLSSRGRRNTAAAPGAAHPLDTRRLGTPHVAASPPPRSEQNTETTQGRRCISSCNANEGPVRIQYKCLIPIYVFPEMKLLFTKHN